MYEVIYHYKEEIAKGEYGEEIKQKKIRVGANYEDVQVEVLAGKIMSQLARRDILIVDVEIYEFTRKAVSYKFADDGILIRNKKFRFDDGPICSPEETRTENEVEKLVEILRSNPSLLQNLSTGTALVPMSNVPLAVAPTPAKIPSRPIRYEVFNPNPIDAVKISNQGLKLKVGRKYGIYAEKGDGIRMVYTVQDDAGNIRDVGAEFFELKVSGKLLHEDPLASAEEKEEIDLWARTRVVENTDQMPVLRR